MRVGDRHGQRIGGVGPGNPYARQQHLDHGLHLRLVRPAGADPADQKRVMTPAKALAAGANWLVIGRPICAAKNPRQAAEAILDSLGE